MTNYTPTGECLCGCGATTKPGRLFVWGHNHRGGLRAAMDRAEYRRLQQEYQRDARAVRKARGICAQCSTPSERFTYCLRCRQRRAGRMHRARRAA